MVTAHRHYHHQLVCSSRTGCVSGSGRTCFRLRLDVFQFQVGRVSGSDQICFGFGSDVSGLSRSSSRAALKNVCHDGKMCSSRHLQQQELTQNHVLCCRCVSGDHLLLISDQLTCSRLLLCWSRVCLHGRSGCWSRAPSGRGSACVWPGDRNHLKMMLNSCQ